MVSFSLHLVTWNFNLWFAKFTTQKSEKLVYFLLDKVMGFFGGEGRVVLPVL